MLLENLLGSISYQKVDGNINLEINNIKYDSREVKEGDLFVCIEGYKTDGHLFVSSAVENGAKAVVIQKEIDYQDNITYIKVNDTRAALADLAAYFYDEPSQKVNLIGVTGTNGKTTTTYLIQEILQKAGYKVGVIGTIAAFIGDEIIASERTTPESLDLQYILHKMYQKGADYIVMEVSSHALELQRVNNCDFKTAVFTNISQDHLDFHEDIYSYVDAKKKLFKMLNTADGYGVINGDDEFQSYFENASSNYMVKYSLVQDEDFTADNLEIKAEGVSFDVKYPDGETAINLKLTGKFSVYNSLAAFVVAYKEGVSLQNIKAALENYEGVAGRFQKIDCGQNFTVIVDYAHTPDSLSNILDTAQEFAENKIITVFGCGGDRDRKKRPQMGEVAALKSDLCLVTSDNPRSEVPQKIIEDIIPGVEKVSGKYCIEADRKKAIQLALEKAQKDDVVIVAGKGHETYQEVNGEKLPFDDREVVREFLKSGGRV